MLQGQPSEGLVRPLVGNVGLFRIIMSSMVRSKSLPDASKRKRDEEPTSNKGTGPRATGGKKSDAKRKFIV